MRINDNVIILEIDEWTNFSPEDSVDIIVHVKDYDFDHKKIEYISEVKLKLRDGVLRLEQGQRYFVEEKKEGFVAEFEKDWDRATKKGPLMPD